MIIRSFYDEELAQASYLVGCGVTKEAIVIDPLRDIQAYVDMAKYQGLHIVAVAETHIHADFLSGTRQLAAATGARMFLSDEGDETWKYAYASDPNVVLLKDGDVIRIGNLSLSARHTPGHTPEHLAFVLTDHPVSETPHSMFSGDFLFVGDVGRPDLLERAANFIGTMEIGARVLFSSIQKLSDLPDSLLIWPGHGAGSACGKSLGGSPVSSLGYERETNWALKIDNESEFVDQVLLGQPEPPVYFKEMKRLNKIGPAVLESLPHPPALLQPVGRLVDVRPAQDIRAGVVPGALVIPFGKGLTNWAGWLLAFDEPVTLVAENQAMANRAARDLAMVGLDVVHGWVTASELPETPHPMDSLGAAELLPSDFILDVRGIYERAKSLIPGSVHIPLGELASRAQDVPRDRRIVVHCAAGGRSPIAYSILQNAGVRDVWELAGGIDAIALPMPELIARS